MGKHLMVASKRLPGAAGQDPSALVNLRAESCPGQPGAFRAVCSPTRRLRPPHAPRLGVPAPAFTTCLCRPVRLSSKIQALPAPRATGKAVGRLGMSLARREQRSRGNAVSGRETGAEGLDPGPRALHGRWAAPRGVGPGLRPQPRPPASPAVSLPVCLCPSSARRRMSVRLPSKPGARQASHQQRQSRVACRAAGHQQAPCSPLPARKHAGALALRPLAARRGCWGVAGRLCRLSRGARPGCHHQSRKRQRQRQRWRGAQAEGAPVVRGWGVEGALGDRPWDPRDVSACSSP